MILQGDDIVEILPLPTVDHFEDKKNQKSYNFNEKTEQFWKISTGKGPI